MKTLATLLPRPGRTAAVVGAVVAASATTLMVFVAGTATAAEAGQCTDNVNVRAQPDADAEIVGVCERGMEVVTGETSNGFVELSDLGGWAAQEFVSINGAPPAAPATQEPSDTPSNFTPASPGGSSDTTGTPDESTPATPDDSTTPSSDGAAPTTDGALPAPAAPAVPGAPAAPAVPGAPALPEAPAAPELPLVGDLTSGLPL
ncbi:MAG: SH3 domain-containing protein [Pseudonocardia sp.]